MRGTRQPPLFSAAQVYRSVLPILEFISCFLSAKKHSFHTLASMQSEHIFTLMAPSPGLTGVEGFSVTWGHSQPETSANFKVLAGGFLGGPHWWCEFRALCRFRVSDSQAHPPSSLHRLSKHWIVSLFLPAGQAFYLLLFYPVHLVHTAHGVQPL